MLVLEPLVTRVADGPAFGAVLEGSPYDALLGERVLGGCAHQQQCQLLVGWQTSRQGVLRLLC
jgi:hypothetical protein